MSIQIYGGMWWQTITGLVLTYYLRAVMFLPVINSLISVDPETWTVGQQQIKVTAIKTTTLMKTAFIQVIFLRLILILSLFKFNLLAWTRHRWLEKSWDCRWRCWEPRDCWLAPSSLQINTFTVFFLVLYFFYFSLYTYIHLYTQIHGETTSRWPKVVFEACWATEVPFLRVKKRPV